MLNQNDMENLCSIAESLDNEVLALSALVELLAAAGQSSEAGMPGLYYLLMPMVERQDMLMLKLRQTIMAL